MASVVADTHALLWHLTDSRRLGKEARRAFAAADAGQSVCHVPVIVLVEIWLLHERGRLRIGATQVLQSLARRPGYAVLPLDAEQALAFGDLVGVRDPMDRMILAAARATGSRLVSCDESMAAWGVALLWD